MSAHRTVASAASAPLIAVDKTLILFDLDHQDAKQTIRIKKMAAGGLVVGWRILCNAPTRYIVKPNAGLLVDQQDVQIQLVRNRFNPQHVMVIEAIGFEDERRWPAIWQRQRKTDQIQTVMLEISTTLMTIDTISHPSAAHPTLSQMMELSQTKGHERVRELQELLGLLKTDSQILEKNIEQTRHLQQVLKEHIAIKREQAEEAEKKTTKLERELTEARAGWEHSQTPPEQGSNPDKKTVTSCCIM